MSASWTRPRQNSSSAGPMIVARRSAISLPRPERPQRVDLADLAVAAGDEVAGEAVADRERHVQDAGRGESQRDVPGSDPGRRDGRRGQQREATRARGRSASSAARTAAAARGTSAVNAARRRDQPDRQRPGAGPAVRTSRAASAAAELTPGRCRTAGSRPRAAPRTPGAAGRSGGRSSRSPASGRSRRARPSG